MAYTKVQLAIIAHEQLSALATDAGVDDPNLVGVGDYANSITLALITVVGSDDVTLVTDGNLIAVVNWIVLWMLKMLYNYYLTAVDFRLGPREEKLSQIARGIQNLQNALGTTSIAPIVFRDMTWTFNDFTVSGVSSWPMNWFEVDWDNQW